MWRRLQAPGYCITDHSSNCQTLKKKLLKTETNWKYRCSSVTKLFRFLQSSCYNISRNAFRLCSTEIIKEQEEKQPEINLPLTNKSDFLTHHFLLFEYWLLNKNMTHLLVWLPLNSVPLLRSTKESDSNVSALKNKTAPENNCFLMISTKITHMHRHSWDGLKARRM